MFLEVKISIYLHRRVFVMSMILAVNSEGPNQTAWMDVQADPGPLCPHMPEDMFSHGEVHVISFSLPLICFSFLG